MAGRFAKILGSVFGGGGGVSSKIIVAPAYDDGTVAMSKWVSSLSVGDVVLCLGGEARHERIVALLREPSPDRRLLIFAGHGKASGLLTEPSLGKSNSPLGVGRHGCLIDTEDVDQAWKGLHVVAWACEAGIYLGPRIASLKDSAFLGFIGALNLVINHAESEQDVWLPAMRNLFMRIAARGYIESHDAEWLQQSLLEVRKKIKEGAINTGVHNRINTTFLKAAAKNTIVHISQR